MENVIIVTGGAGGIGSAICRGLAADGLKVVVADYAKEAAEKVAAEIRDAKGDAIAAKVDVGNPQSVAEMMAQAVARYGRIDYAFCGAGVM
ncbi:MAG: SDR family oxidoreductase, partial [Deltaproteobacteria bacterium]|nr:SDR family oxidoreductase [Deltaproteobacteria bacterium]